MPTLISVLVLAFMLAFGRSATADFTDVFVTGSNFTYDDQIAVTQTNALAGSTNGTAPTSFSFSGSGGTTFSGSCFSPNAGSSDCTTNDLNGSLDSAQGRATASIFGDTTRLDASTSSSTDASKTTFAAAASFARAGADLKVSGVLTGDTPVVDLGGIILFGGTDPLGTLFALEITDQTPKLTPKFIGDESKVLNKDIRSLSFLGASAQSILGTPSGWTESNPSKIFYKLVVTLLPDGTLSVSDGGLLGSGFVTAADFPNLGCGTVSEGFFVPSPTGCPAGIQTQRTLTQKEIHFGPLPDPQAFTLDTVKLETARVVPEPASLLLLGSGLLSVAGWRFVRRSR